MHLFRAMNNCHQRLMEAAEALREELDTEKPSAKLIRLRLDMAIAARSNLSATQKLWARIEKQLPDVDRRVPDYRRLKAAENELHVRYASHIAAWPVSAVTSNFREFANAKKTFLDDLCQHVRLLEINLFEPAYRAFEDRLYVETMRRASVQAARNEHPIMLLASNGL